jgi:hypothetical protein
VGKANIYCDEFVLNKSKETMRRNKEEEERNIEQVEY